MYSIYASMSVSSISKKPFVLIPSRFFKADYQIPTEGGIVHLSNVFYYQSFVRVSDNKYRSYSKNNEGSSVDKARIKLSLLIFFINLHVKKLQGNCSARYHSNKIILVKMKCPH